MPSGIRGRVVLAAPSDLMVPGEQHAPGRLPGVAPSQMVGSAVMLRSR